MANCANDLTSVDLEHLRNRDGAPSQLALGATRDDSLYSYVVLDQCSASNAADPDGVKRVIRPLDTKDVVRLNETAGFGASAELGEEGVPTGGCIETHLGELTNARSRKAVKLTRGGPVCSQATTSS